MYTKSAKKGFTLIELVIATTIAALVGMGIYKTFSNGITVWRWIERNKPATDSMIFFEKLAFDLRNLCSFDGVFLEGSEHSIAFFIGNDHYLSMAEEALLDSKDDIGPPLSKVRYEYDPVRQELSRHSYAIGQEKPIEDMVVLSEVSKMRFFFYDFNSGEGVFSESQAPGAAVPYAVGIELQFRGSDSSMDNFKKIIIVPLGK